MNKNPLNQGMIEENAVGIGEISGEMVAERAKELAMIADHPVSRVDHDQAFRELTGGDAMDPKQAMLESATEAARWNPVAGSTGHQMDVSASEDEDTDGQGESARLFAEGVREAAHDQMLQAAIAVAETLPADRD